MYKFYISRHLPFWGYNTENKPSPKVLQEFVSKMEPIEKIGISNISPFNLTLTCGINDIKYIKIENTINNEVKYYFVDSIQKISTSTSHYTYNCILDVYCTYTIQFINDNIDKELIFIRQDEYSKECLQLDDELIEQIPKYYTAYNYYKHEWPKMDLIINNVFYGNVVSSYHNWYLQDSNLNANTYYVFSNGANNGYRCYPVLGNLKEQTVYLQKYITGDVLRDDIFLNGEHIRSDGLTKKFITISPDLIGWIKNDWPSHFIKYYYRPLTYNGKKRKYEFGELTEIKNIAYGTLPSSIYTKLTYSYKGNDFRIINFAIIVNGQTAYTFSTDFWTHSENAPNEADAMVIYKNASTIYIKEYKKIQNGNLDVKFVDNTDEGLNLLYKKENFINKFKGKYFLPNILAFKQEDLNFENGYLYININHEGIDLSQYEIYTYALSNIQNKLNNNTYSSPYLLKYMRLKYFDNNLYPEYRLNKENKIVLGGKLYFADSGILINKGDDLLNVENSTIVWPYQLPYSFDKYEQYVAANRNVSSTGYNIAKRENTLNKISNIFNGSLNTIKSGTTAIAGLSTLDTSKTSAGILGSVGNIGNSILTNLKLNNNMANLRDSLKAQYDQAKMTMGNELLFSNVKDLTYIYYYLLHNGGFSEQYEVVEVSILNETSLTNINNILFFYGYLNPKKSTFNEKLNALNTNEKGFTFIQIDATLLELRANLIINSNITNDVYDNIKMQLENGIRIWNKDKIYELPTYDYNEVWPDQPEEPPLPPLPPIENNIPSYTISGELWTNHCAIEYRPVNLSISILPDTNQIGISWTSYNGQSCSQQDSYLFNNNEREVKIKFTPEQCKGEGIIDGKRIAILVAETPKNTITLHIPKNIGYILWNPIKNEPATMENIVIYEE